MTAGTSAAEASSTHYPAFCAKDIMASIAPSSETTTLSSR